MKPHHPPHQKIIFTLTGLLLIAGISYGSYFAYTTYQDLQKTKNELDELLVTNQSHKDMLIQLEDTLSRITLENEGLNNILTEEQVKVLDLKKEAKRDARKINTLEKLTTIDPELLRKYSKVFFLSENYIPPKLKPIELEFKINPTKNLQILADVEPYLHDLLEDARDSGVNLRIISAFRSFEEQTQLKSAYTKVYGSGANQFSADQGYSEHQLGTTIDFGTPTITGAYLTFENSPEFKWLQDNAYKYGFILSYPKGNSYYEYEPWHWRFVGEDLADDLYADDKSFYELDQREIDEYLIKIFD